MLVFALAMQLHSIMAIKCVDLFPIWDRLEDFYLGERTQGRSANPWWKMWADRPTTTMSIVICAGVPRAPLVDSHHLHESPSCKRACRQRVVPPPPNRTIHNARSEPPEADIVGDSDFTTRRFLYFCITWIISFFFFFYVVFLQSDTITFLHYI